MKRKKKSRLFKDSGVYFFGTLILLFDLLFLYAIKYSNQQLPLTEFSILKTGNFLNLLFVLLPVAGFIFLIFRKGTINKKNVTLLYFFLVISTLMLFLSWLIEIISPVLPEFYFLEQPLFKIMRGFLFSGYQFFQFMLTAVVWLQIFYNEEYVLLRSLVIAVFIFFCFPFITLYYGFNFKDHTDEYLSGEKKADIGVVLGAAVWSGNRPSPILSARVDRAAELYLKGSIKKIQFTGSNAPGELAEAEVAYRYLQKYEIPDAAVLFEDKTTSTTEQVSFIKYHLMKNKDKKIVIISDKFHLKRVEEICKFYSVKVDVVASKLKLSRESNLFYRLRDAIALIIFWFFAY